MTQNMAVAPMAYGGKASANRGSGMRIRANMATAPKIPTTNTI